MVIEKLIVWYTFLPARFVMREKICWEKSAATPRMLMHVKPSDFAIDNISFFCASSSPVNVRAGSRRKIPSFGARFERGTSSEAVRSTC